MEGVEVGLIASIPESEQKVGGEVGFGLAILTADDAGGIGISGIFRGSNSSEGSVSLVMFKEGLTGFSADVTMIPVKGGTEYERPGICLLAGAASLSGIWSYSAGAGFYGDIYVSRKIMIQPMAAAAFFSSRAGRKNGKGFQFSLLLLVEIAPGVKSRLDLSASAFNVGGDEPVYEGAFGLRFGMMFGEATDNNRNMKDKK